MNFTVSYKTVFFLKIIAKKSYIMYLKESSFIYSVSEFL